MIFTGSIKDKNITLVNPKHIIDLKLVKGRTQARVKGDTDGDTLLVKDLEIREPWSVQIRTATGKYFINLNNLEEAIKTMTEISCLITTNDELDWDEVHNRILKGLTEIYE